MAFDIGPTGLAILFAIAAGFGALVYLVTRHAGRALAAAAAWFAGGILSSEVVWGSLTEEEIQPIVDGLAFDESLLGGLLAGGAMVAVLWFVERGGRRGAPSA